MEQMLPDNVQDNLNAAASPITPEPTVNDRAIAAQMRHLMAAGYSPEEAAAEVQADVARLGRAAFGGVGGGADASWEREQSMGVESAAGRRARAQARSDRQDAWETDYNTVTGHPEFGFDLMGNPARLGRVDIDNPNPSDPLDRQSTRSRARQAEYYANPVAGERDVMSDDDWDALQEANAPRPRMVGRRAPGPRTMSGLPPAQGAPLTEDEAVGYMDRGTTHEGEAIHESQQDKDMRARGMVPVVMEDGSVAYMVEAVPAESAAGVESPRGGVGRRGYRPGMAQAVDEERYTVTSMRTPYGETVQVYARTPEDRKKNGVIKVPGQSLAQRQEAYQEKKSRMEAEREESRRRWRAMTYLAGGGQNLNDSNRWIAASLADMSPAERQEALREMMPINHDRAMIEAQSSQHAMELARSALHNSLANSVTTPMQQQAMAEAKQRNRQAIATWGQQQIDNLYANPPGSWFSTEFTVAEREALASSMSIQFDISLDEAREIVDGLASPYDVSSAGVVPGSGPIPTGGAWGTAPPGPPGGI